MLRATCLILVLGLAGSVTLTAQEKKEPRDPTIPQEQLLRQLATEEARKIAAQYLELRKEMRQELLGEIEGRAQAEAKIREDCEKRVQAALLDYSTKQAEFEARVEKQVKAAMDIFLTQQQREQELRLQFEQKLDQLRKDYEERFAAMVKGIPAPMTSAGPVTGMEIPTSGARIRIKGVVGQGVGPGGVTLEINGELRTLSVGDTFNIDNITYRIANVSPQGVSIVAERPLTIQ